MISLSCFVVVLILLFFLDHLMVILMNPTILTDSPTNKDSMEVVDQSAGRSLAIFALVLVVIQFSLDGNNLTYYEMLSLATLIMAAGFLITTFILELIADLKTILFRIQLNSLRYSGLLLFLGLFLLLKAKDIPDIMPNLFGIFVAISWFVWFVHELHYIFKTQKKEWNSKDTTRNKWITDRLCPLQDKP